MKSEVRELLTEELKDAYSAEKQALRCMQRAVRKASAEELREGIQMHIEQTQVRVRFTPTPEQRHAVACMISVGTPHDAVACAPLRVTQLTTCRFDFD